jgi:hypothetical protein
MDMLITLGVLSAYCYSIYALCTGGEVYFDTAAMITPSAMDKEYLASPGRGGELHPAAQGHRIESQDTTGKVMRHFAEPDHRFLVAFGVGGRSLRIFSIALSVKAAGCRLAPARPARR